MIDELLLSVECPGTCLYTRGLRVERTAPCFDLVMACILMTLPIVLGAKRFETGCERAPIWAGMALLVFSSPNVERRLAKGKRK